MISCSLELMVAAELLHILHGLGELQARIDEEDLDSGMRLALAE